MIPDWLAFLLGIDIVLALIILVTLIVDRI